jgi:hypothetical protein
MNANIFETIALVVVNNNAHLFINLDPENQEVNIETLKRIFRQMFCLTLQLDTFLESEIENNAIVINQDVFRTFMENRELIDESVKEVIESEESSSHISEIIAELCIKDLYASSMQMMNFVESLEIIAQVFVLVNKSLCFAEEDFAFAEVEYEECQYMYCHIMGKHATIAEVIEIRDNTFHTTTYGGNAMNAKIKVIDAIINHIPADNLQESIKHVQRTALYIALHTQEVHVLSRLNTSDFAIPFGIGITHINHTETIHTICEYVITNEVLHEDAEREIVRPVLFLLCREEELPELEYPVEFTQVMYDIFQMLRISCIISDRIDILEALKNVFSFEEHEEYQELIQYINATTEEYTEDVY